MTILVTILIFLAVLGLLIFVHELGHFLTARRNGITCHEFGFGFPPRIGGIVRDAHTKKWRMVWGSQYYSGHKTLYSLNWIPLGGFVRIKGEDGSNQDQDSFGSQSIWVRFNVLIAGVLMNFILAWVLISLGFILGVPQSARTILSDNAVATPPTVQVLEVSQDSPAQAMGIKLGDVITQVCTGTTCEAIATVTHLQDATRQFIGRDVSVSVQRGEKEIILTGALAPTEGGGSLGVSIEEVSIVSYPWWESFWWGIGATATLTVAILQAFGAIIWGLIAGTGTGGADLAGPVGIAVLTKQVTDLGLSYLLQFAALLSINLGIINAVPFPALDGGRILFLLIEKIKGSPVSKRAEGIAHSVGFMLLIGLMVYVTAKDFIRFQVVDRFLGLF